MIFQDLGSGNHDIFSVTPAGTGVVPLAATAGDEYHAAISPDRATIAYVRDGHLWLMNSDGTSQHPVMNINVEAAFPAWSRDGSHIATGLHYLFTDTSTVDNDPAVSPDGSRIAVTRGVLIGGVAW